MKRAAIVGAATVLVLVLVLIALAVAIGYRTRERSIGRGAVTSPAIPPPPAAVAAEGAEAAEGTDDGYLYARIATVDGATFEGRLRFGGDQEAFWGDYCNGTKSENPWAAHLLSEQLPRVRRPVEIFGFEVARRERPVDLGRPFMARFGDIARIEARGRDVRVALKSGSVFDLDRFEASDFDDGLRIWDEARGVVDFDSLRVRTIELLPTPRLGALPGRLHGTVRTRRGDFTGFVQWDRRACVGSDELHGRTAEGEVGLRFGDLRAIARRAHDGVLATLADGREIGLSGGREVGDGNRGIYVDDPRYGRVLVSWDAFERLDFGEPGGRGSGPAYDDFPPGRALKGSVTTRAGRRFAGRLVFDLDESETTETLDAPSRGVDYTLPFGRIASIALPDERSGARSARVTLHGGERLELERAGDLGESNAGLLLFADGGERPEYVPWSDVERIDLDPPPARVPPLGVR